MRSVILALMLIGPSCAYGFPDLGGREVDVGPDPAGAQLTIDGDVILTAPRIEPFAFLNVAGAAAVVVLTAEDTPGTCPAYRIVDLVTGAPRVSSPVQSCVRLVPKLNGGAIDLIENNPLLGPMSRSWRWTPDGAIVETSQGVVGPKSMNWDTLRHQFPPLAAHLFLMPDVAPAIDARLAELAPEERARVIDLVEDEATSSIASRGGLQSLPCRGGKNCGAEQVLIYLDVELREIYIAWRLADGEVRRLPSEEWPELAERGLDVWLKYKTKK